MFRRRPSWDGIVKSAAKENKGENAIASLLSPSDPTAPLPVLTQKEQKAAAEKKEVIDKKIKEAADLIKSKRWITAEPIVRAILAIHPEHLASLSSLGVIVLKYKPRKPVTTAAARIARPRETIPEGSQDASTLIGYARDFQALGMNDEAGIMYRGVVLAFKGTPDESIGWHALGMFMSVVKKDYLEAEKMLKKAIASPHATPKMFVDAATILNDHRGKPEEAENLLREAVDGTPPGHPELGRVLFHLGVLRYRVHDDGVGAAALLKRLVEEVDHSYAPGYLHYGFVRARYLNDPHGALANWKVVLQIEPNNRGALALIARLSQNMGLMDDAEKYYIRGANLSPSDPEVQYQAGMFFRTIRSDVPKAEAFLRKALVADPKHERAMFALGVLLQTEKQDPEGAGLLRKLLILNPSNVEALVWMGHVSSRTFTLEEAERFYLRALAAAPESGGGSMVAEVHRAYATFIRASYDDLTKAQDLLLTALKHDRNHVPTILSLAAMYADVPAVRDMVAAEDLWRRAVAVDPGCQAAHARLRALHPDAPIAEGEVVDAESEEGQRVLAIQRARKVMLEEDTMLALIESQAQAEADEDEGYSTDRSTSSSRSHSRGRRRRSSSRR